MFTLSKPLASVVLVSAALAVGACKKEGPKKGESQRLHWVKSPTSGSTEGRVIKIPSLGITFETPEVLYVFKECTESSHTPDPEHEGWIPVLECRNPLDEGGDELDEGPTGEDVLHFYVAKKDLLINERSVATLQDWYKSRGYKVESINYIEDYQSKPGRRGIETKVHQYDSEGKYPEVEIWRFRFPVEDVLFIASVEYPYGDDRSGVSNDWQRILWNFQLDEDGPLYSGGDDEEAAE